MADLLRTDFDEFLFASIGEDASGGSLTLLSALARLDIDAWDEAAKLAGMPVEKATEQLATMLATLPNAAAPADTTTIAARLIGLLHRPVRKPVRSSAPPARPPGPQPRAQSKGVPRAVYYVAAVIFLLLCQWASGISTAPAAPHSLLPSAVR
jgi:hypothetical protein